MGWFKRRREKRGQEQVQYYGQILTAGLYPSLRMSELGEQRRVRPCSTLSSISGGFPYLSGAFPWPDGSISGLDYIKLGRQDYHPPVVERALKCQYCGSQFISRVISAGNGRELKPLVELKCPNCAGAIGGE